MHMGGMTSVQLGKSLGELVDETTDIANGHTLHVPEDTYDWREEP